MPDIWFDVDTALAEVPVNIFPLVDDTDFKSREASVAYNATGMDLVWNFVTSAGALSQTAVTPSNSGNYLWTNQGDGMYSIQIPASGGATINNDTEGYGWFTGIATGILAWRSPIFGFRAAAINDALVDGGDYLDVNAVQISGDGTAADNAEAFFDGTGYAGTGNVMPIVTTVTNGVTLAADAVSAAALKTDAVTEITGGVLNAVAASYDTSGTIGEAINNAGSGAVTVNAYVAVSSTVAQAVSTGSLAVDSYYTFAQSVTSTTTSDLSAATKIWWTIKDQPCEDSASLIFVEKTGGLTVVNKATYATTGNGSITLSGSSGAWVLALGLDEAVTAMLDQYGGATYDAELKAKVGNDTIKVWSGDCVFTSGLVRTNS